MDEERLLSKLNVMTNLRKCMEELYDEHIYDSELEVSKKDYMMGVLKLIKAMEIHNDDVSDIIISDYPIVEFHDYIGTSGCDPINATTININSEEGGEKNYKLKYFSHIKMGGKLIEKDVTRINPTTMDVEMAPSHFDMKYSGKAIDNDKAPESIISAMDYGMMGFMLYESDCEDEHRRSFMVRFSYNAKLSIEPMKIVFPLLDLASKNKTKPKASDIPDVLDIKTLESLLPKKGKILNYPDKKKSNMEEIDIGGKNNAKAAVIKFDHPPTADDLKKAISEVTGLPEDTFADMELEDFGVHMDETGQRKFDEAVLEIGKKKSSRPNLQTLLNNKLASVGCVNINKAKYGKNCMHTPGELEECEICIANPKHIDTIESKFTEMIRKHSCFKQFDKMNSIDITKIFCNDLRANLGNADYIRTGVIINMNQLRNFLVNSTLKYGYYDANTKTRYTGICKRELGSMCLFDEHGKFVMVADRIITRKYTSPKSLTLKYKEDVFDDVNFGMAVVRVTRYARDGRKIVPGSKTVTDILVHISL